MLMPKCSAVLEMLAWLAVGSSQKAENKARYARAEPEAGNQHYSVGTDTPRFCAMSLGGIQAWAGSYLAMRASTSAIAARAFSVS